MKRILIGMAVVGLLAAGSQAQAATRTWNNGTSGFWTNGATWGGTAPGSGDTANFTSKLVNASLAFQTNTLCVDGQYAATTLQMDWAGSTYQDSGTALYLTGSVANASVTVTNLYVAYGDGNGSADYTAVNDALIFSNMNLSVGSSAVRGILQLGQKTGANNNGITGTVRAADTNAVFTAYLTQLLIGFGGASGSGNGTLNLVPAKSVTLDVSGNVELGASSSGGANYQSGTLNLNNGTARAANLYVGYTTAAETQNGLSANHNGTLTLSNMIFQLPTNGIVYLGGRGQNSGASYQINRANVSVTANGVAGGLDILNTNSTGLTFKYPSLTNADGATNWVYNQINVTLGGTGGVNGWYWGLRWAGNHVTNNTQTFSGSAQGLVALLDATNQYARLRVITNALSGTMLGQHLAYLKTLNPVKYGARTISDLTPADFIIYDNGYTYVGAYVMAGPTVDNANGATNVTLSSANLNGTLTATGAAPATVTVYWGTTDGGTTAANWATNAVFDGNPAIGPLTTNIAGLPANTTYFYRYCGASTYGTNWAPSSSAFITAPLTILATQPSASEVGPTAGIFTVARPLSVTNADLAIAYTIGGTASNGVDYQSLTGTVTILAGQTNAFITVMPIPDRLVEGTETVEVALADGPYVVGSPSTADVAIADGPINLALIWDNAAANRQWNTNSLNWHVSGEANGTRAYADGDTVTFTNTGAGTISIAAAGVTPGGTTIDAGSYTFQYGAIGGAGAFTINSAGVQTFYEMIDAKTTLVTHSGGTLLNAGSTLQINHTTNDPVNAGISRLSFGAGPVTFNGGTLHLDFQGLSWGNVATFTNSLVINAGGGTLNLAPDGANQTRSGAIFSAPIQLNGDLTVTGNSGANTLVNPPTFGNTTTVNGSRTFSNATSNAAATVILSTLAGSSGTLTLAGQGFTLYSLTNAMRLNISNLVINAGLTIENSAMGAATFLWNDPFSQLVANGGGVTVGPGGYLAFYRCGYYTPGSITWGNNTNLLWFRSPGASNQGDDFAINGTQQVGGTGNPATLRLDLYRGGLGLDENGTSRGSTGIRVNSGGKFTINEYGGADGQEKVNANVALLNGAVLQHDFNTAQIGGFIRYGLPNTLTLGDGSGTPSAPSMVTVQGNQGADLNTFNIGWATNTTESGTVRMKYANTVSGAANFFNVGWSAGGSTTAGLLVFKTTSGGTEFAPLSGSGGVAVISPASGFLLTNNAVMSTAGTVGFYKAGASNVRGTLGTLVVTNTGTLAITNGGGRVQASDITINGGTLGSAGNLVATNNLLFTNAATCQLWLYGAVSNQCGLLVASNRLAFSADSVLSIAPTNGFTPTVNQFWYIAVAGTFDSLPANPSGYTLDIVSGNILRLTKLGGAGYDPVIANETPTNITSTSACLNGWLQATGAAPATVSVYWGPTDAGMGGAWANTNQFPGPSALGHMTTNVIVSPNTVYYYRYGASNAYNTAWADPVASFISGELSVSALTNAGEVGPVTGLFSIARSPSLTNEAITVTYTMSGTASNGVDYLYLNGITNMPAGASNVTVVIVPSPDFLVEGVEYATLTLQPGTYALGPACSATVAIADYPAKTLTWTDGSGSHKWNAADTNWVDGGSTSQKFADADIVTFTGTAAGTVTIASGGVNPGGVTISGGSYTFQNGSIGGAGAFTINSTGVQTFYATNAANATLVNHAGGTTLNPGSTLQINHSNGDGPSTLSFGAGTVAINGGTLYLDYLGSSWANVTTFTNALAIGAGGGTLNLGPDGSSTRRSGVTFSGPVQLNGDLTVTGNSWGNTLVNPPTFSALTVTGNRTVSNGTYNTAAAVILSTLAGSTSTLTLAGQGFTIYSLTNAARLNISNLVLNAALMIDNSALSAGAAPYFPWSDPLTQLVANGGGITVGPGGSLSFYRCGYYTPGSITWGNYTNMLWLRSPAASNEGNDFAINGTQQVGGLGNPATLRLDVYRGGLGLDEYGAVKGNSGIRVNSGGRFIVNLYAADGWEVVNANLALLDGAVLQHDFNNAKMGGLIRFGLTNTLTLGDGTGTLAAPSVVTVRGNEGTDLNTFNIGWATNTTESGTVRMKYASTTSGTTNFFNVGWSAGGANNAALRSFKTTSGGTEFAPLAGSGGVAVVGPTSGAVSTLTNEAALTTAGTVGFYNAGANNARGAPGLLVVTNGGTLTFTTNGTIQAGNVTFYAGSTQSVAVAGTASNAIGYLTVTGTLTYAPGARLVGSNPSRIKPAQRCWYVAEATTISGLPSFTGLSGVEIEAGTPQRLKVYPDVIGAVFIFR